MSGAGGARICGCSSGPEGGEEPVLSGFCSSVQLSGSEIGRAHV